MYSTKISAGPVCYGPRKVSTCHQPFSRALAHADMSESQLALILYHAGGRSTPMLQSTCSDTYANCYMNVCLLRSYAPTYRWSHRVCRRNGAVRQQEHIRAGDPTSLRGYLRREEAQARTHLQTIPANRTNSWNEQKRDSAGADQCADRRPRASRFRSTHSEYESCRAIVKR
jgi:hypothetical protein